MSQSEVTADPAGRPGFGLIRLAAAAAALLDPRFRIQGPDERAPFLGPQGWQPADVLLQPRGAWRDGDDLVLEIGPEIVDIVEDGTVGFSLPAALMNVTLIWPILTPSRGGVASVFQPQAKAAPDHTRTTGTIGGGMTISAAPDATTKPEMQPDRPPEIAPNIVTDIAGRHLTPDSSDNGLPKQKPKQAPEQVLERKPVTRPVWQQPGAIAGVLAVFAGLALIIWLLFGRTSEPGPFNYSGTQAASGGGPSQTAQINICDQQPYPAVLQCEHDPARLFKIGNEKMRAGDATTAILLYQAVANDGYGPAALALASLYDPATFQPNAAITQADAGQAARYYRMATNDHDSDAAAPRARLYQLLQARAGEGDINAPNWLSDYWP